MVSFEANLYDVRPNLDPNGPQLDPALREHYVSSMAELITRYNTDRAEAEQLVATGGEAFTGETALVDAIWAERQLIAINDAEAKELKARLGAERWVEEFMKGGSQRRAQLSPRDRSLLGLLEVIDVAVLSAEDEAEGY